MKKSESADQFDAEDFDFAYNGPLESFNTKPSQQLGLVKLSKGECPPRYSQRSNDQRLQLAIDFHNKLPEGARPELTEGYEGFYHLMNIDGTVEEASASYIIRDFETESFEKRKDLCESIADQMNAELGSERVLLTLKDQYYNMKQVIEKDMTPITLAKEVMEDLGITQSLNRSAVVQMDLKFPLWGFQHSNIFPKHAWSQILSLQTMERAVDTIIGIVTKNKKQKRIHPNPLNIKTMEKVLF